MERVEAISPLLASMLVVVGCPFGLKEKMSPNMPPPEFSDLAVVELRDPEEVDFTVRDWVPGPRVDETDFISAVIVPEVVETEL